MSWLLGSGGAWVITNCGRKLRLLDDPNDRSSHRVATPKGGGIGILITFIFISLLFSIPKYFWISSAFLAIISFWGDRQEISPNFRLSAQFIAALILLVPIATSIPFSHNNASNPPYVIKESSIFICFILSVFIVGTANFYNFMDGIDGIAGITGVVGFGLLAFYAYYSGTNPDFVILAVCMSLACLGFLPFNIPTAKVFMGDVGSILLGFVFAGTVVYLSKSLLDFFCAASFLFPFYADEITTLVVRVKDGDRLTRPHRRHLYQLLANEYGIEHWRVSLGYGLSQLIIGVSILLIKNFGILAVISALLFYFCCFIGMSCAFRKKLLL
ncbi:MAG TPA: glycosyltransferase family 4 protein [Balneolales bacterium]|nr:glycosyltransferase family 4 protein [Balneolales bacterium]